MEEEKLKEKSLKLSIKEGSATALMSGAGESYIIPYALALNASNFQIGFMTSFVGLFSALSQIFGSKLVYKHKRKKIIIPAVFFQATSWILIVLLTLLTIKGYVSVYAPLILVVLYSLYGISGGVGGPAWFSLMGDLVHEKKRGNYFSKRNKIVGFITMIVTLTSAIFLDYTKELGFVLFGFIILFLIAAIGRYISAFLLSRHYEPNSKIEKESYFGFVQFIKNAPKNNFGKFVIYVGLINLATNFAGPFFAVYMLKDLHYSYLWFILVNLSGTLFTIIAMPFWGKIGDTYGNRRLLQIGGVIITFSPILWIVSGNPIYLIFSGQLLSGIGWAAFNLGASNFIYDAVTPQRRAICVAYFTLINGLGIFIGASLGGIFAQFVQIGSINTLLIIFLLSGLMRGIISLIFLPKIKEVRKDHQSIPDINLLSFASFLTPRPFFSIFRGIRNTIIFASLKKENKTI